MSLAETAIQYRAAGLCVLPARLREKRPALYTWREFQKSAPTEEQLREWFGNDTNAACLLCGTVSGNLELLDFDRGGELLPAWIDAVEAQEPGLVSQVVVERSQSGGKHVVYRCAEPICGNIKLAQRVVDGRPVSLIETRGEGGLFLCAPSPGYELEQGSFTELPILTPEQREVLLSCAWGLNEYWPQLPASTPSSVPAETPESRPGDEFNARGDVQALLVAHGWALVKDGENQYWRRPGKTSGHSATLKDRVFYVHSSNAAPFEPQKAYSPFHVLTTLEHGGDFKSASRYLRAAGWGSQEQTPESRGVDLSGFRVNGSEAPFAEHRVRLLQELVDEHPRLREPIIHGLLREGETMNLIAPPKTGKSWLVMDLALSVATGGEWLGMKCEQGDVLVLDNELHPETSAFRFPKVMAARGVGMEQVGCRISIDNMRGRLQDLEKLRAYFEAIKPGTYKVVILDAFYRFLPKDTDENDNGTMAALYNLLDSYARNLKCCFILIHHTSKGNQSAKDITDVGAGAGSMTRATDTHLVMRRHEEPDTVVLDSTIRSWAPMPARCLRWEFPVWNPADDLDPEKLQGVSKKEPKKAETPGMTLDAFVAAFVTAEPKALSTIRQAAIQAGHSENKFYHWIRKAKGENLVFEWHNENGVKLLATVKPPEPERPKTKTQLVQECLEENPNMSTKDVAARCDVSEGMVRRIKRENGGE